LMSRAGRRPTVGQEIRLAEVDIDAGAGMGAFEALNGAVTPATFATSLKDAAARYHGTVGQAWLRFIVADRLKLADLIRDGVRRFVGKNVPKNDTGQAERVARRFGLVAVAGELATSYGLTGWPEGAAIEASASCFGSWLQRFGGAAGNREERALLARVKVFFEQHGASRFENASGKGERVMNRAGFFRTDDSGTRKYLVFPEAFRQDVCAGFDRKFATQMLLAHGWILPGSDGKTTQKPRLPGIGPTRVYVFGAKMWEGEE
jgi:putative DNA primase/helicase